MPIGSSLLVNIALVWDKRTIVPRRKLRFVVIPVLGSVVVFGTSEGIGLSATQLVPSKTAYLMPQWMSKEYSDPLFAGAPVVVTPLDEGDWEAEVSRGDGDCDVDSELAPVALGDPQAARMDAPQMTVTKIPA